jgi:hypothetical protein
VLLAAAVLLCVVPARPRCAPAAPVGDGLRAECDGLEVVSRRLPARSSQGQRPHVDGRMPAPRQLPASPLTGLLSAPHRAGAAPAPVKPPLPRVACGWMLLNDFAVSGPLPPAEVLATYAGQKLPALVMYERVRPGAVCPAELAVVGWAGGILYAVEFGMGWGEEALG